MNGKNVCYHHGAKSPVGAGSATFKDGTRSKYSVVFTGDALEHYERAAEDPRYIELRDEINVLDVLFFEELSRARVGEGGVLWEEIGRVWTRFQEAQPTKDTTTAGRCLGRMGEIIEEGVGRHAAQEVALDIAERKRKLTETERRRIVEEGQAISQVKAMSLVGSIVALVRESVAGEENERRILARFHSGVARLVHQDVARNSGEFSPAV